METNQSICRANYLTGFYMMVAVIVNWLDKVFRIFLEFCKEEFPVYLMLLMFYFQLYLILISPSKQILVQS